MSILWSSWKVARPNGRAEKRLWQRRSRMANLGPTDGFTVTEEHIKLLKHMNVWWDGTEHGAPGISPKRPYGNSDVYEDIADILGISRQDENNDEDWSDEEIDRMDRIHQ